MQHIIGLDIGGTKCAVVLGQIKRGITILSRKAFETAAAGGVDGAIARLMALIDQSVMEAGLTMGDIRAIGISCGGPLDSVRGMILYPPNLPDWVNIPIVKIFEEKYGVPTFLQNDANACALVEWRLGAGRGSGSMIFLTMGTGNGAGVIMHGKLLTGACDMCGEIGHLRLSDEGPLGFGKHGSLEGYTSGGGIGRQAQAFTKSRIDAGDPPAWSREGHALDEITAKLIARYAKAGDRDALSIYETVGGWLGQGLALLIDTLNPEKIVIGSIFVRCEELLRPAMQRVLEAQCIPEALAACPVVPAQTGEAIGDLAAVMVGCHGLDIDPCVTYDADDERVKPAFEALFARYPDLECLRGPVAQAYSLIADAYARGGKLLICGNGGSGADAEHIVGELMKGFTLKRPLSGALREQLDSQLNDLIPGAGGKLQGSLAAISLTQHVALSTAFGNDVDAGLTFAQQTLGYGKPGDAMLAISTSGNAKNVTAAAIVAKALGMGVVALTGGAGATGGAGTAGGGILAGHADVSIIAPGESTAQIQERHLPIYHALCEMLERAFFAE